MYSSMGTVCAAFPSDTRDDDGGYPTVCLSQDLNGPDMICANNGYNWFSVSSEYSDRYATYANPFARYAIFYNQIKAANDIILSIDPATASETEKYYLGQAKAVRAFDYLCLAPYYQFRYATSKDLPCVPLITEETTNFVNNPRATVGKVYEQIISDLNSAIDIALRMAERDYKIGIPCYYPKRNVVSLLLPIYLTVSDKPDLALIIELTDSGNYQGQTVFTLQQAYIDARMICPLTGTWLDIKEDIHE